MPSTSLTKIDIVGDLPSRFDRVSIHCLGSPDEESRQNAIDRLALSLLIEGPGGPVERVLNRLERFSEDRVRDAIGDVRAYAQRLQKKFPLTADLELTMPVIDALDVAVLRFEKLPVHLQEQAHARLGQVQERVLNDMPDDAFTVRKVWAIITNPPFRTPLPDRAWQNVCRRLLGPDNPDKLLESEDVFTVLWDRTRKQLGASRHFVDGFVLAVTNRDRQLNTIELAHADTIFKGIQLPPALLNDLARGVGHLLRQYHAGQVSLEYVCQVSDLFPPLFARVSDRARAHFLAPYAHYLLPTVRELPPSTYDAGVLRGAGRLVIGTGLYQLHMDHWVDRGIRLAEENHIEAFHELMSFMDVLVTNYCALTPAQVQRIETAAGRHPPDLNSPWTYLRSLYPSSVS